MGDNRTRCLQDASQRSVAIVNEYIRTLNHIADTTDAPNLQQAEANVAFFYAQDKLETLRQRLLQDSTCKGTSHHNRPLEELERMIALRQKWDSNRYSPLELMQNDLLEAVVVPAFAAASGAGIAVILEGTTVGGTITVGGVATGGLFGVALLTLFAGFESWYNSSEDLKPVK